MINTLTVYYRELMTTDHLMKQQAQMTIPRLCYRQPEEPFLSL